jgi:hypothetical protein
MPIKHSPKMEPREPSEGDIELLEELEEGDEVNFFEWAVEPLTVMGREEDENVGECVRVEAEGGESFLYVVGGRIWHYVDEEEYEGDNNPFPVQNLCRV